MSQSKESEIKTQSSNSTEGTIEDIKESVTVLERVAQIFKTIFELFKSKEK